MPYFFASDLRVDGYVAAARVVGGTKDLLGFGEDGLVLEDGVLAEGELLEGLSLFQELR